ncbi:hypothetical protein [Granulibacter bethesdensis]|uniref:hypothetical protein n=1 Tax=Granulibacter bethesdensis TaxID=364410 RepID=UPI0003F2149B|nr:hypothetical protein [Granulibacter bethesdensis]AHJ66889.1 Hypothetical protein GbCGDNIH4_7289 [Granulibacter bethesdensis CGDNIH4]APH60708.1 Hypothetical protein GbCGDNIH7_7220 [Granulibacter bethesdensis]
MSKFEQLATGGEAEFKAEPDAEKASNIPSELLETELANVGGGLRGGVSPRDFSGGDQLGERYVNSKMDRFLNRMVDKFIKPLF